MAVPEHPNPVQQVKHHWPVSASRTGSSNFFPFSFVLSLSCSTTSAQLELLSPGWKRCWSNHQMQSVTTLRDRLWMRGGGTHARNGSKNSEREYIYINHATSYNRVPMTLFTLRFRAPTLSSWFLRLPVKPCGESTTLVLPLCSTRVPRDLHQPCSGPLETLSRSSVVVGSGIETSCFLDGKSASHH